ncbi:MAG: DpnII family type II restriction endonuclease [Metamycoplasmataceae bacterium]
MNYNNKYLEDYLSKLKNSNLSASKLINFSKINLNMRKIESDLNTLNYIICKDEKELKTRLKFLFENKSFCFESIFILTALRADDKLEIEVNDEFVNIKTIISHYENIFLFLKETGIIDLILESKIKNFVDYVWGIEVGLDTNGRKNRNGKNIEIEIFEKLETIFKNDPNIEIKKQESIPEKSNKVFDFIIKNKSNNFTVLVESSFYNTGGSKISETASSYLNLRKEIEEYKNQYLLIWLADGKGMKTIKSFLNKNIEEKYIYNHNDFFKNIKKIMLN